MITRRSSTGATRSPMTDTMIARLSAGACQPNDRWYRVLLGISVTIWSAFRRISVGSCHEYRPPGQRKCGGEAYHC
jgi:hypothetical protein